MIVKVSRWKALAEVLQYKRDVATMEEMEDALTDLMIGLGAQLKASSAKRKTSK